MNRKGDIGTFLKRAGAGIFVLVVVILGAVVLILGGAADRIKLFPSFGQEQREILGDELVGIDLSTTAFSLKYYTGTSWKIIEGEKFETDSGKEIDTKNVGDELEKFYFKTPRKPENPKWRAPDFKEWTIDNPVFAIYLYIREGTRPEYTGPDKPKFYFINIIDNRIREGFAGNKFITSSSFLDKYDDVINEAIEWRDQILEGMRFERFVTLEINVTGEYEPRKYTVRKSDQYVFVDLARPVSGADKYSTEKVEEIKKDQDIILINDAQIEISFDLKKGVKGVFWGIPPGPIGGVKGWYVINEFGSYLPAVALGANEFKMSSEERLDFYLGLQSIADDLDRDWTPNDYNDIIIKIIGGDGREAIIYQTEDGGKQGGMIESVVNAYNAQFEEVPKEEVIVEETPTGEIEGEESEEEIMIPDLYYSLSSPGPLIISFVPGLTEVVVVGQRLYCGNDFTPLYTSESGDVVLQRDATLLVDANDDGKIQIPIERAGFLINNLWEITEDISGFDEEDQLFVNKLAGRTQEELENGEIICNK